MTAQFTWWELIKGLFWVLVVDPLARAFGPCKPPVESPCKGCDFQGDAEICPDLCPMHHLFNEPMTF